MANLQQEYPGVLLGILEELANMRQWLTFQDLCRMVSARFDLEHLIELRSLLFAAASQDPCFPATLFRDRVSTKGQGLSPIGVAADIVTIFNLIQMTVGVPDDSQPIRAQMVLPVDQCPGPSLPGIQQLNVSGRERVRAHSDSSGRPIDQDLLSPRSNYSGHKRASLPPDPISLVSSPPIRARAVSFDLPHTTLFYPSGQIPNEVMKNIYLPLETDSESSVDSAPMEVFDDEQGSSVDQKRDIFRKDFHNRPPLIPQVTVNSESPSPNKDQKGFDNRIFETIPNPYPSPAPVNQSPEQKAKRESLDDLQDSTYFGPRPIPEWSPRHLQPPRTKRPIWSNKSHSLEDRIGPGSIGMGMESQGGQLPRRSSPAISKLGESLRCDSELSIAVDGVKAQGTQTDPPDARRLRSLVHADRFSFMTSLDDPDIGEDDISAIFRFLDDISMCGSTAVLHPSDGPGAINQDTHEARRGRLGQLQRLFHSLESSDDGLQASVCKLLLRMSQIERQLDSLNDVKAEISQVLSALQRLDEKIQPPISGDGQGSGGRWLEPLKPQPLSDASSGRASKSQPVEKNMSDSNSLNISARDWTVSFSKSKDGKSSHGQVESFYCAHTTNLISRKSSNLVEQVFSSSLFHHKDSSLTGGLTSGKVLDPRFSEGRGRPIWTVDEREARISPLDLQNQESLNPNNMEFWMDDIYTPGYDTLLRRKEADLRRAKVCKLLAVIATAVVIIVIIVILICTVGS
uniref:Membrane integral NOTCH2 associated receptor 1 n=1 Tax=Gasterosteus aculeatus aculeatus TaxID=481459 RepID=G3NZW2_GASAC